MENKIIVAIAIVGIVLIIGIFFGKDFIKDKINLSDDGSDFLDAGSEESLGNLCSGEKECREFCFTNEGRCKSYCRERYNELCKIIYPVQGFPSCADGKELFTVSPVSFDDLDVIAPLGSLNPSGHVFPTDHMYFNVQYSETSEGISPLRTKVFSPGDVSVVQISSAEHLSAETIYTDYDLEFYPCKEVYAKFGHVTFLSEKLQSAFDEADGDCTSYTAGGSEFRRCTKPISVQLQAGEEIGAAGGFRGAATGIDFWLVDYRLEPITFANPARMGENTFYITCPLEYFTAEVKDGLFAIVRNRRTIEPVCGTIAQDIIGRAQGIWFLEGTQSIGSEDPHIALAHDNFNPLKGVFSVGTSITGLDSTTYLFDPQFSGYVNRDFADVMPGNIYCYGSLTKKFDNQVSPFRIILEMTSDTEIMIEKQDVSTCGSGPWSFSSSSVEFER